MNKAQIDPLREPAELADRLRLLVRNLWWTWQPDLIDLFREIDPELWRAGNHNPIAFLRNLPDERLAERARELDLATRLAQAEARLADYLARRGTWARESAGVLRTRPVVYLSPEFALHESLPIYSGGLGILAGDHLKAASDLGLPIVGIGIYYARGYFRQRIDRNGRQNEDYGSIDPGLLPLEPLLDAGGAPLRLEIPIDGGTLRLGAWQAAVGRATLYLLDSNVDGNPPHLRELTAQLYGGDSLVRLRQELILGVGGVRLLAALGIEPGVIHLNEGHSAFAALELARLWSELEGIGFGTAHRVVASRTVFTTHTPVPAGHDWFPPAIVTEHLGWLARASGISEAEVLGYGRVNPDDLASPFCMTVLALRSSAHANAVSSLHGSVSREMWRSLHPDGGAVEVPIGHVTNGVHAGSWLAPSLARLYAREIGVADGDASEPLWSADEWRALERLDDALFWDARRALKAQLLDYLSRRRKTMGEAGESLPPLDFDPRRLTIGFARRFAEYKRSTLLFRDVDRLARLVGEAGRGLQLVFAGKAHPRDEDGKRAIARIFEIARDPRFAGRITFVEDYDYSVGRHLVQGVDLWLNAPRRPLEACGTSGQKAVLNGVLHCSTLDGWWAEAWDGENGYAFGGTHPHSNWMIQDQRDAESLYEVLERQVVPDFYARDRDGIPRRWTSRMRHALATLAWRFGAERMLRDYVNDAYLPAAGALPHATAAHGSFSERRKP